MLEILEKHQIKLYLFTFLIGSIIGILMAPGAITLEKAIEPTIGILLYSMFCQIPFQQLLKAFKQIHLMIALIVLNFIMIPLLAWGLISFLPNVTPLRLGAYLVLLTPCVDYVIFFTKMGQGDYKLMLASTPLLLIAQIILLPFYLWFFMGDGVVSIISTKPFLNSFLWLIIVPLVLALFSELYAKRSNKGKQYLNAITWLPIPMMAIVLFVVAASESDRIYHHLSLIAPLIPLYIAFMVIVGILAWFTSLIFGLNFKETRTLWFSGGTRNSLVVLPLALGLPTEEWVTLTTAVIVTQTIVELFGELIYIRIIPFLISKPEYA